MKGYGIIMGLSFFGRLNLHFARRYATMKGWHNESGEREAGSDTNGSIYSQFLTAGKGRLMGSEIDCCALICRIPTVGKGRQLGAKSKQDLIGLESGRAICGPRWGKGDRVSHDIQPVKYEAGIEGDGTRALRIESAMKGTSVRFDPFKAALLRISRGEKHERAYQTIRFAIGY